MPTQVQPGNYNAVIPKITGQLSDAKPFLHQLVIFFRLFRHLVDSTPSIYRRTKENPLNMQKSKLISA